MRFKVGDRVRIKSIDWYNKNKDEYDYIDFGKHMFYPLMSKYCGKVFTIDYVYSDFYTMNNNDYDWTDEMIEGLVEEESANYSKVIDNGVSNPIIAKTSSATIDTDKGFYSYSDSDDNLEMEWNLPKGYIFKDENGNVINATKIILEKKKKEYPKTYEECCKVLGIDTLGHSADGYKWEILSTFQNLLICRDAYWKIAGEQMGLGKPWEPDYSGTFENGTPIKYVIYNIGTHIVKERKSSPNHILSFPTEEMPDAFKENFDPDIEFCKEFL